MEISLTMPNGELADYVQLGVATLDVSTLRLSIEVVGFDKNGNKMVSLFVPHQLDVLREVPEEEKEAAVYAYFQNKADTQPS